MLASAPPIPPELMQRIREFLATRRNGEIVLYVHDGAVASADLCDRWRKRPHGGFDAGA